MRQHCYLIYIRVDCHKGFIPWVAQVVRDCPLGTPLHSAAAYHFDESRCVFCRKEPSVVNWDLGVFEKLFNVPSFTSVQVQTFSVQFESAILLQ